MTSREKVTIDVWQKETIKEIFRFTEHWKSMQRVKGTKKFPDVLPAEDWDERCAIHGEENQRIPEFIKEEEDEKVQAILTGGCRE